MQRVFLLKQGLNFRVYLIKSCIIAFRMDIFERNNFIFIFLSVWCCVDVYYLFAISADNPQAQGKAEKNRLVQTETPTIFTLLDTSTYIDLIELGFWIRSMQEHKLSQAIRFLSDSLGHFSFPPLSVNFGLPCGFSLRASKYK